MKVVVIDDSRLSVSALQNIVGRLGHDVVATAFDGTKGIEVCKQHRPQAVCLDFVMPGLDGLQTAKLLREELPSLKIIMITQNKLTDAALSEIAPVASVLKPITADKLRDAFGKI